jgi:hypothetical protein
VSWLIHYGVIPPGQHVLHRCDNPPCVRPDHLFLGNQGVNNRDMVAKGRHWMQQSDHHETPLERWNREHPERAYRGDLHHVRRNPDMVRGENNGRAKLTTSDVLEMRQLRKEGRTFSFIGSRFGVTKEAAMYAIKKPWGGLEP